MNLASTLAGPGVQFRSGPFVCRVRSALPEIAQGLAVLYADHALTEPHGFADFHVEVRRVRGLRAVVRPQVEFCFDGERPFKPLPRTQSFAMLEWGLNWCVASHAHTHLVIHAASLEKDGRALIMPAPPGSGKSTLCAALMLSGWRLLSDELTLIDLESGWIHPLARPVNLKNASIDLIAKKFPHARFGPVVPDTHKGRISHLKPDRRSVHEAPRPARAEWVVYPRFASNAPTTRRPVGPAKSFMSLAGNAFNYTLLGREGFLAVGALTRKTQAFSLEFGDLDAAIEVLEALA